jgi:GGDEF domain-containing protein
MTYITYVIIQSVTKGAVIQTYVYFWIVMSPALTTAFSLFTMSATALERQVAELNKKLVSISTLNEDTKLKNLRSFENDVEIYMSIAARYNLDFGVLLLKFKYQKEIEKLSRKEGMKKIVVHVADVIRKATRAEDELYQIDDDEIIFGLLLLTKREGVKVLQDRLKEKIAAIDTNEILNTKQLVLDMKVGMAFDDGKKTVLGLLEAAKDAMQYDV